MVLVIKPEYRVVLVDGVTHFVAEPPGKGTVELLRDLLGWEAHYDAHNMTVELRSPPCVGGCEHGRESGVETAPGPDATFTYRVVVPGGG